MVQNGLQVRVSLMLVLDEVESSFAMERNHLSAWLRGESLFCFGMKNMELGEIKPGCADETIDDVC